MLSPQEARLLASLRPGPIDDRNLSIQAGLPAKHLTRILYDMEWRGLVVVMRAGSRFVAMLTPTGSRMATG